MASDADPYKNSQSDSVAGASPLSTSATPQATPTTDSSTSNTASQPSTIQSSSKTPSTNTKAPKASSGLFTNIQKYVDKNKPSAQKLADSSVSDIRKTQEDLKNKQQETLAQFTTNSQQGGLHETSNRVADINAYTTEQANLPQQYSGNEEVINSNANAAFKDGVANRGIEQKAPVTPTVPESNSGIDENRFTDIINASYTGPKNLTETGNLYQSALDASKEASNVGNLAQTTEGREQLLREKFTQGGKQYGQGASQLDNLLMGQQTNQLSQMQNLGKEIGSTEDIMRKFTTGATDVANQTREQVEATKNQARAEFQAIAQDRQGQVDSRVGDVVENWDKLPAHFREALSNPDGTMNLSQVEAAVLGVSSGEGLYNLTGEDLFGDGLTDRVEADTSKLITTNEQQNLARLHALSNLAQTEDSLYDINNTNYANAENAGTQTAFDALDIEGVRNTLADAEQSFRDTAAEDTVGTGVGRKYYNKSLGRKGRAKATSTKTDTLQNQLADKYDFDSDISREAVDNSKYLDALSSLTSTQGKDVDTSGGIDNSKGVTTTDFSDSDDIIDDYGNFISNNYNILGDAASLPADLLSDGINGLLGENNEIAKLANIPLNFASDTISALGDGVSDLNRAIFGSGSGAAKKKAKAIADANATKNLQANLEKAYEDSGFANRIGVADTEENSARNQQLMNLLNKLDKSNI